MSQIINKRKAKKYFKDHPEPEKARAKELIDMMDDAVNNALVLSSCSRDFKYSVDYSSSPSKDFEVRITIKEKGVDDAQ